MTYMLFAFYSKDSLQLIMHCDKPREKYTDKQSSSQSLQMDSARRAALLYQRQRCEIFCINGLAGILSDTLNVVFFLKKNNFIHIAVLSFTKCGMVQHCLHCHLLSFSSFLWFPLPPSTCPFSLCVMDTCMSFFFFFAL